MSDVARHPPPGDPAEAELGADGGRLLGGLAEALARWFGPYGYHALLTRALAQAQAAHPALADVRVRGPLAPALDGLTEATQTHGARATRDAVSAIVAAVITLLGRVIGEDVASRLVTCSTDDAGRTAADPTHPAASAAPVSPAASLAVDATHPARPVTP